MKLIKISTILALMFFMASQLSAEVVTAAKDVSRVSFNIYQSRGTAGETFEGYIIFYNKNGKPARVQSNNRAYVWVGETKNAPTTSDRLNAPYYQEIPLATSSFKSIKLRTGETVIGIAIPRFTLNYKYGKTYGSQVAPRFRFYWKADGTGKEFRYSSSPVTTY